MDNLDKKLINLLQKGLPVCEKPFYEIAKIVKSTEKIVINKVQTMLENGLLTRFGPMFDAACLGGAFTLAAMKVPKDQFEDVAQIVNSFEQVAHNYERKNELNMWFVIGTETQSEIIQVIKQIEYKTGINVVNMPKEHEFFVGLYLPV